MSKVSDVKKSSKSQGFKVSIRWKALILFSIFFSVVYFFALNSFTTLAVRAADEQIKADLTQTLENTASSIDVEMLLDLAETGEPNDENFSDDPRFIEILTFLDTVHTIEPDSWPYLYIPSPVENEIFFVVDVWALYDPSSAGGFLEAYTSNSGWIVKGLDSLVYRAVDHRTVQDIKNFAKSIQESNPRTSEFLTNFGDWLTDSNILPTNEFGTYGDQFGRWASGYMPLENKAGEKVAAIGIDFQADYVNQVRREISAQVQRAFLIAYPVMIILMFIITSYFTRPLLKLTANAERIADGDYDVDFSDLMKGRFQDEIDTLASVFEVMVDKVHKREEKLKRQVASLKIEIDQTKQKEEIDEIVDTDFFKDLQLRASKLRADRQSGK